MRLSPIWTKTQKGRIVYSDDRPKPFSEKDAARVLRSVLEFNTSIDSDAQVLRLFEFLFHYGFLGINIPIWKESVDREVPAWYQLVKPIIDTTAGKLGVPQLAQSFAEELGNALQDLVDPPKERYLVSSGLARLMSEAQAEIVRKGEGIVW